MGYASLEQCLQDLEKHHHLVRIKEEVDPNLEMAAIHLRVHELKGPALLFENVKSSKFRCASNIFGTLERSQFIFRDRMDEVKRMIALKKNPLSAFKNPLQNASLAWAALKALPLANPITKPVLFEEISIQDLPLIKHWPMDGGAFVTLPQVYTEDIDHPGIMQANLGMYRIQLSGNQYIPNQEIGLHYQLHRGIGVHQTKANQKNLPLKVSCFVGGPPAHTLAAVMPLPEGMSEATFAGLIGNRRFRYTYKDGFCVSTDADFVITGEVEPELLKPEGPFGDHLGYYSLTHLFPVLKVHKVYAKKNAIWPFTVVGRPPQEDTSFGALIHDLTGNAITQELPGVKEIHAVDAAGVHPLLLAIGSERYTPYAPTKQPAELLTIANHILGTGQLSLAKFLWITADDTNQLSTHRIAEYFQFILQRVHLERDIHFYTNTTIDTLDYSGEKINTGSKVVIAAYGEPCRILATETPEALQGYKTKVILPGILAIQTKRYTHHSDTQDDLKAWNSIAHPSAANLEGFPLWIWCDDVEFIAKELNNFLWIAFTRCNPSHDMHGINEKVINKHWSCSTLILDARIKPHHAPALEKDETIEKKIDRFFTKGGPLAGLG